MTRNNITGMLNILFNTARKGAGIETPPFFVEIVTASGAVYVMDYYNIETHSDFLTGYTTDGGYICVSCAHIESLKR